MDHSVVFLYVHLNFFKKLWVFIFYIYLYLLFLFTFIYNLLYQSVISPSIPMNRFVVTASNWSPSPSNSSQPQGNAWRSHEILEYCLKIWGSLLSKCKSSPDDPARQWTNGSERMNKRHSTNELMALNEWTNGTQRTNQWLWTKEQMN